MIKLFRYLKPFRIHVAFVLVLIFLQTLANLYLPTLMSDIVDTGIVNGDVGYILKIGGVMLLVACLGSVFSVSASYFSARAATGFGKLLRRDMFTHVENFSLQAFEKIGTASLITRTTNDITQVQQVMAVMMRIMVMAPLMCVGGILMAVSKDAKLSLVLVSVVPVLSLFIFMITRKGMPLFKALQKKLDGLNLILRERLTGIRVIRSFHRDEHEMNRFDEANNDFAGTAVKVNQIMATMFPVMMLTINFATVAIVWFGSIRIDHGDLQVGDMMAFIQYAMQIMFSLMMMMALFIMVPRASVSAGRINEVLQTVPEVTDPENPKEQGVKNGKVVFRDVSFRYPGAEQPVLTNISFDASPGEVTAIIGGTGSGKSTLAQLIPRFYDVESGVVSVNGLDVRQMTQEHLREKIGFVPQKAVLFSGSVIENVRYGKESASEQDVRYAAQIAQADGFISEMKDGYQSVVTQGGSNLSGGQKQRLSIARALVKRPEIYVFDDSFSALDYKTDAALRKAMIEETEEATVLIVAQRVSTVMDADKIIVLDEGEISGAGTHQELMESCEVYQEIVASQLSEEEIA